MDLTDEQWILIPLFPPPAVGGRGRPPLDQRTLINGILWTLRCNKPWRTVRSHEACYQHYNAYKRSGVIKQILAVLLQDLLIRGKFDFAQHICSGIVQMSEKEGRVVYYIRPEYSEDWRVSTSLIFYHKIARQVEQQYG